jgi:formylglycine-generating enzyme required for sulfatase activity
VDIITQRAAEDSVRDVGALPLLSYTLDDMWTQMVKKGDGVLRLPTASFALGGVLVERADKFLATHPGAEIALRRVLTLRLASVHEEGEPTRRRAMRSEFSEEEWRLVSELADHPNRLLVTVTPETGETYAEVAHEAIFRHWSKLREWIAAEKDFLVWRSGLESARRAWQATPDGSKNEAVLMGFALEQALRRLAEQAEDIPAIDRDFIAQSSKAARRRKLRLQALVTGVALGEAVVIVLGIIAWINQSSLREKLYWFTDVRGQVLTAEQERALKPKDVFKECTGCPEMIVVPAGSFTMGSPTSEAGREEGESQHRVTIAKPFAVAKFELTFDEWDACVDHGDCDPRVKADWGRGRQPAINVSWDDAQWYLRWLSRMTGKPYRLLSEAEWEFAARGITSIDAPNLPYPWGDKASHEGANYGTDECCKGKIEGRDQWVNTAPVGQFPPNAFGLYDMHGNVWEWVEDRWHDDYGGAPQDGSVWAAGGDDRRVVRGGSWIGAPEHIRSAAREKDSTLIRSNGLGFRVARTLGP